MCQVSKLATYPNCTKHFLVGIKFACLPPTPQKELNHPMPWVTALCNHNTKGGKSNLKSIWFQIFRKHDQKELSFCHILWFSNLRPLIFQTKNSARSNSLCLKYQMNLKRLENWSLWQKLNSFSSILNFKNRDFASKLDTAQCTVLL